MLGWLPRKLNSSACSPSKEWQEILRYCVRDTSGLGTLIRMLQADKSVPLRGAQWCFTLCTNQWLFIRVVECSVQSHHVIVKVQKASGGEWRAWNDYAMWVSGSFKTRDAYGVGWELTDGHDRLCQGTTYSRGWLFITLYFYTLKYMCVGGGILPKSFDFPAEDSLIIFQCVLKIIPLSCSRLMGEQLA